MSVWISDEARILAKLKDAEARIAELESFNRIGAASLREAESSIAELNAVIRAQEASIRELERNINNAKAHLQNWVAEDDDMDVFAAGFAIRWAIEALEGK